MLPARISGHVVRKGAVRAGADRYVRVAKQAVAFVRWQKGFSALENCFVLFGFIILLYFSAAAVIYFSLKSAWEQLTFVTS